MLVGMKPFDDRRFLLSPRLDPSSHEDQGNDDPGSYYHVIPMRRRLREMVDGAAGKEKAHGKVVEHQIELAYARVKARGK
ncbi:MAG: hypothetical protein ACI8T1_000519 [Verrucomicrobiales bacterium]|jgi:hypothetical protein